MSSPLISIIIPTYNRAHLIGRAVESVQVQSYKNWEIIIVDDGSTDNTEAVIKPFLSSNIKYLKINNSGAAEARNRGAAVAAGEFLTFLDSDDAAHPLWLEKMTAMINSREVALVSCGIERIQLDGTTIVKRPNSKNFLHRGLTCRFNGGSFLLSKSLFEVVGGYDGKVKAGQHTELGVRLVDHIIRNRQKATFVDEALIKVFEHRGPKIRQDHKAVFEGSKYFLKKHGNKLRNLNKNSYFLFLSSAGVRGIAAGHFSEAQQFLFRAWKMYPFSLKAAGRLLLSLFPNQARKYWKRKIEVNR